jgi:hypothetical protein
MGKRALYAVDGYVACAQATGIVQRLLLQYAATLIRYLMQKRKEVQSISELLVMVYYNVFDIVFMFVYHLTI